MYFKKKFTHVTPVRTHLRCTGEIVEMLQIMCVRVATVTAFNLGFR